MTRSIPVLPLFFFVACSGAALTPTPTAGPPIDRGPTQLAIDGDPNGLWWDAGAQTLFIADDDGNRILTWSDADGFGLAGALPAAPEDGPGLGQVVRRSDGTLVVPRFGYGTTGDVVSLSSDGAAAVVPGLDVERRRIGLTVADDGTLYDSWFVKTETGRVGAVGRLSLEGAEPVVVDGLVKPVGVLWRDGELIISDQDLGQLLRVDPAQPGALSVVAEVESPDLLCLGPGETVLTGSSEGEVMQVGLDGAVTLLASGFRSVRGVAFDAENGRVFVVDHDDDESDGITHTLQIVPVGP